MFILYSYALYFIDVQSNSDFTSLPASIIDLSSTHYLTRSTSEFGTPLPESIYASTTTLQHENNATDTTTTVEMEEQLQEVQLQHHEHKHTIASLVNTVNCRNVMNTPLDLIVNLLEKDYSTFKNVSFARELKV